MRIGRILRAAQVNRGGPQGANEESIAESVAEA
jgi:hypothetical protein